MDMNLANKLTMLRVVMIPVFLLVLFLGPEPMNRYIAVIIFIVASLTDMLDGKIARKYNLVTNFGKFMDPLADKLLVSAAMICLVELARIPSWIVIIIISREFIISDNDFHTTLFHMAGKKNVMYFFQSINSQYERFRTFINLGGIPI